MTHRTKNEPFSAGKLASMALLGKELDFNTSLSPECVGLLRSLLTASQSKRLTIKQIFSQPWMIMKAAKSGIDFKEYLDKNREYINMDESLSVIRSKYRGSNYLQDSQADNKVAKGVLKSRFSEGNLKKGFGSTTRESVTPYGVNVSPHL